MTLNRNDPRLYKLLLAGGLLLLLLWLGLKGWRVARAARSLQARQAEAETLLEEGVMAADPEAAEALVLGLRQDIATIRDEVGFLVPLAPAFDWLPTVGPLLAEAPALLQMADAGSEAAVYGMHALKPALVLLQEEDGGELIPSLLPILEEGRPYLVASGSALEDVVAARAEIEDEEALPWRIRSLLEQFDRKLYLTELMPLLGVAPELLGSDRPRTYLIMAQNEDEIRPTGGFLTGAGLLTVDEGRIGPLQFLDGNLVDAWEGRSLTKPYNPPPEPLNQLMGLPLFLFRDANFWPDFPTSAEQAIALYRYGQEAPPIDGVIALDQQFVSTLLRATGAPLAVAELGITVSGDNVVEQMRRSWEQPEAAEEGATWANTRKDFLGPLAEALKTRLLTEFNTVDPLFFADNMYQALEQKHLQLYVRDPEIASILDKGDWDGRVEAEENGDLLLPVDTNVGYNKVGANIESAVNYDVALAADGTAEATATLVYTHTIQGAKQCRQGEAADRFSREQDYAGLASDCFWNYLRLYVPAGSTLLDGSEHRVPASAFSFSEGWEGGPIATDDEPVPYTVLSNFFLLRPGETATSSFRYRLPRVVQQEENNMVYHLSLPRQAGANPRQAMVQVTLPAGARLQSATPFPASQSGQTLTFAEVVATDFELTIVYE